MSDRKRNDRYKVQRYEVGAVLKIYGDDDSIKFFVAIGDPSPYKRVFVIEEEGGTAIGTVSVYKNLVPHLIGFDQRDLANIRSESGMGGLEAFLSGNYYIAIFGREELVIEDYNPFECLNIYYRKAKKLS